MSPQKGIVIALMGDVCGGPVSRIHGGMIGQRHQDTMDGMNQRGVIAPRQIGSPNTPLEEDIPGNHAAQFRNIEA